MKKAIIKTGGGNLNKMEGDVIVESSSLVEVPSKLVLMPGERILEKHLHFFVSNKRIIEHKQGFVKSETTDYSFKHIKGLNEIKDRPLLKAGLILGFLALFMGFFQPFLFVIGAILITLAFWYKNYNLVIYHVDGNDIKIPEIKSESGQRLAQVLRTQFYDKN